MVSSGSGGFTKQVEEEEKQLLKELEALSHALHRAEHPASSKVVALNASKKKQPKEGGFQRQPLEVRNSSALLQEIESRSGWSWRPLRALSHLGQQAFPCLFLAHVHSIRNLPASMTGLRLKVQFSQRSSRAQTLPCRVSQGSAEIDEAVSIRCTVYAWSKKASQGIKYLPKCLILTVVAVDLNDLEVDRHQMDLTQMLPERFSEGCGKKDVDQTTRFYLSGKANGGTLMVSFGYEILGNQLRQGGIDDDGGFVVGKSKPALNSLQNSRNLAPPANTDSLFPRVSDPPVDLRRRLSMEDVRIFEGKTRSNSLQFPHRSSSFSHSGVSDGDFWGFNSKTKRIGGVHALQMGDSAIQASKIRAVDSDPFSEDNLEFEVEDYGVEISTLCVNAAVILPPLLENREDEFETPKQLDVIVADKHPLPLFFPSIKKEDNRAEVVVRAREWTLNDSSSEMPSISNINNPEKFNVENSCNDNLHGKGLDMFQKLGEEKNMDLIDGKNTDTVSVAQLKTEADAAALILDNEEDSIEGKFLQMLEEEHQFHQHSSGNKQNSPKVLQVKTIGSEALLNGAPSLDLVSSPVSDFRSDDDQQKLSSSISVANTLLPGKPINMKNQDPVSCGSGEESELRKSNQKIRSKIRAKLLEDAETEALMHEWGLDEKAFQSTSQLKTKH